MASMIYVLGPLLAGVLAGEGAFRGERVVREWVFGWRSIDNMKQVSGQVDALLTDKNVKAFLRLIRQGESGQTDAAFRLMNGGQYFAAPPWRHPGRVFRGGTTTAAGAFQLVVGTWNETAEAMGLADFSPMNQARAAVGRMAYRNILGDVQAGRVNKVLAGDQAGIEWEALKRARTSAGLAAAIKTYEAWGGGVTDR